MPQLPLKVKFHRRRGVIKHGQRIRAHVFHVCRAAFQLIHHVLDMRVIQAQKALCNVLPAVFAAADAHHGCCAAANIRHQPDELIKLHFVYFVFRENVVIDISLNTIRKESRIISIRR